MCGRTKLETPPDELREIFGLDQVPDMQPRFNLAPTDSIAVIRQPRRMELLRWGLILPKSKGPGINVRIETAARAPQYRDAFRKRRCLVVVDGFYEWQKRGEKKQPFAIVRADRKPFALAGIWEESVTHLGEVIDSVAIITGEPAGPVASLHDRMPLRIAPADYGRWLDPTVCHGDDILALVRRDADDLVTYAVGPFVNSVQNDDPRVAAPIPPDAEVRGSGNLFER
jgi:putative SOS response-associated peptidase YedK